MKNLPVYRLLIESTDANRTIPRNLFLRKTPKLEVQSGMRVVKIGTLPELLVTARERWGEDGAHLVMDAAVIVQSYRIRHPVGGRSASPAG